MKKGRGFTLIELVVVIVIAGLLTTASAVTIFSVKQKRQTKAVAKQIKNVILEAHAYAISPKISAPSGAVDIVIDAAQHNVTAQVGADIISSAKVSSKVTLKCATGVATGTCLSFENANVNTIGQVKSGGRNIVATNDSGEIYNINISPLSGNVTITTP